MDYIELEALVSSHQELEKLFRRHVLFSYLNDVFSVVRCFLDVAI